MLTSSPTSVRTAANKAGVACGWSPISLTPTPPTRGGPLAAARGGQLGADQEAGGGFWGHRLLGGRGGAHHHQHAIAASEAMAGASAGRDSAGRHRPGDLIGSGKYTVDSVLGTGSNAVTYKALMRDGTPVAVKTLSLRGMEGWKQLQLFEREAATLRALSHPGIPRYLDYFEEDFRRDRVFYLVQELAVGGTLAEAIAAGELFTEAQIVDIARKLLDILAYLGDLRPAVVHRDVKVPPRSPGTPPTCDWPLKHAPLSPGIGQAVPESRKQQSQTYIYSCRNLLGGRGRGGHHGRSDRTPRTRRLASWRQSASAGHPVHDTGAPLDCLSG